MPYRPKDDIPSFQKCFAGKKTFVTKEVAEFFAKRHSHISQAAIHWKIHTLKQQGVIKSLGKGEYALVQEDQPQKEFSPNLTASHKNLFACIKKRFPLVNICLWPVRSVHEFVTHLPAVDWTIIEVEKDLAESLYSFLREKKHDVYLNPSAKDMNQSVAYDRKAMIIKNLVSESPLIHHNKISWPTIEKVLVDLFVDTTIFDVYQGQELANIYRGAFAKYQINRQRLNRYARRRSVFEQVQVLIAKQVEGQNE